MHSDPELLALLALGEDVGTESERRHTQTCSQCADELSQLHRLTVLGRSAGAQTTLVPPSEDVWLRIRGELSFDLAEAGSATAESAFAQLNVLRKPTIIPPIGATPTAGRDRVLVAQARLTSVEPQWSDASGSAELSTDDEGRRLLQVALRAELPTSGVRQAWLVHRDDPNVRQSLGILDGPHGLWTVERSLDLEQFAILDISQQETGENQHSGQIIVRGALTLVS